jgi:hypothetical protein
VGLFLDAGIRGIGRGETPQFWHVDIRTVPAFWFYHPGLGRVSDPATREIYDRWKEKRP